MTKSNYKQFSLFLPICFVIVLILCITYDQMKIYWKNRYNEEVVKTTKLEDEISKLRDSIIQLKYHE